MTESQPAQIAQPAQPAPPVPAIAIFFPPPPRRLRLRAGRWPRWARRILVLVVVIVGIGLIASIALDAAVRRFGSRVQGVVVRTHQTPTPRGGHKHWIDYSYDADARHFLARDEVRYDRFNSTAPGDLVPVSTLVLPLLGRRISALTFASDEYWDTRRDRFTALIFWLIACLFVAPLLRRGRRERLLRDGVVAAGSIVSVTRHKTRPALLLEYRFTGAGGSEHFGIHTIPGIDIESPLRVGDAVTIFYNPRRPDQSIVYELTPLEVEDMPIAAAEP